MKWLSIFVLLLPAIFLPLSLRGANEEKLNVVDYFLRLPQDALETPAREWLQNCGVIDKQNGYMSCTGDGAQPNFEVALFRYGDPAGGGLLAICQGELEGPDSVFLNFFEMGADGKMKKVRRSIFPVGDAGNDKGDWRFELPRQGRTVLVRSRKSGKVLRKLAWNGEKFQEDR